MISNPLTHLRPRRLGELIDLTLRLYRQNFLSYIGIIALVLIPITLLQLLISLTALETINPNFQPDIDDLLNTFAPNFLVGCFFWLLSIVLTQGLATSALTYMVAQNYLGQSVTIIDAYKHVNRVWLRLAMGLLLMWLFTAVIFFFSLIIPFIGWLFGLVLAWGACIFIWVVIMPFMAPVIVLEKQSLMGSIRRSWDLTRRRFWWVLGYVLVLYIFGQFVIAGPVGLVSLGLTFLLEDAGGLFTLQIIIQTLVQLISSLLFQPLQLAAITLLYFDLCIGTEGLDLAFYTQPEINTNNYTAAITTLSPLPKTDSWLTGNEVGKFFIIALVIAGFVVVVYGGVILLGILLISTTGFGP